MHTCFDVPGFPVWVALGLEGLLLHGGYICFTRVL